MWPLLRENKKVGRKMFLSQHSRSEPRKGRWPNLRRKAGGGGVSSLWACRSKPTCFSLGSTQNSSWFARLPTISLAVRESVKLHLQSYGNSLSHLTLLDGSFQKENYEMIMLPFLFNIRFFRAKRGCRFQQILSVRLYSPVRNMQGSPCLADFSMKHCYLC